MFLLVCATLLLPNTLVFANPFPGCENPPCLQPPPVSEIDNGLCKDNIRTCALRVVNYILTFTGIIAVVAIIYFGFLWITSAGNDEQITTGKKGIAWVGAGIILILLSWTIVNFFVGWV